MKNFGLNKLRRDKRDRSHHLTFGAVSMAELPAEYIVQPLDIDDQGFTLFCTSHATSESAESQFGEILSPDFTAAATSEIAGENIALTGADLRDAMKAGSKFGFLPQRLAPFTWREKGDKFVADLKNWSQELIDAAKKYLMDGYYTVDGPRDFFDNARMALWMARQDAADPNRTIDVGSRWYDEWERVGPDGIIPENYSKQISLHAHRILGWTTINGVLHIVDQQAQGKKWGKNGLCFFPRSVVNKEFGSTFGAYIFRKNPDPSTIKTISTMLGIISKIVAFYTQIVSSLKATPTPVVTPDSSIPPPVVQPPINTPVKHANIITWAHAIEAEEGSKPPKPTDRNKRLNNPGNLRTPVPANLSPYMKSLGALYCDKDRFCIFPDYETGFGVDSQGQLNGKGLCQFLIDAASNQLLAYHDVNLMNFTSLYAQPPTSDYANNVAKKLGVSPSVLIKTLL